MCRFSFVDRLDAEIAIRYCSALDEKAIKAALNSLEHTHGVIEFDENAKVFDFIAESSGLNEFKRIFQCNSLGVRADISNCNEEILQRLSLFSPIETSFAQEHDISSIEWCFRQLLISSIDINQSFLSSRLKDISQACSGESPRGLLIYAYCNKNSAAEINRLTELHRELELEKSAIIIFFIDDNEGAILSYLTALKVLGKFSVADSKRFEKYIVIVSNQGPNHLKPPVPLSISPLSPSGAV